MAKMVVSFSVTPLGTCSTSVSQYVRSVTEALRKMGLKYKTGAGFTDVEIDSYQQLAELLERVEKTLTDAGVQRILFTIKIDRRLDKELFIEEKIAKAEGLKK